MHVKKILALTIGLAGILLAACSTESLPDDVENNQDADSSTADYTDMDTDRDTVENEDTGEDSDTDGSQECKDIPDPYPAWLVDFQDDIVGALSGEDAILPGIFLLDRASVANRQQTRDHLLVLFDAMGLEGQLHEYATGANVWAALDATVTTGNILVLGAHLDSVSNCPGAVDNASGVAAVLSVARYLKALPCRNTNVFFVLFDQEEVGLLGSDAYAAMLADTSQNVVSAHTVDMMGWDEDGDLAFEIEKPSPGLFDFYAEAISEGGFDVSIIENALGATDHDSFRKYGFDAVGLSEEWDGDDTTPFYHCLSGEDSFETVNFEYLRSTTGVINYAFARYLMRN